MNGGNGHAGQRANGRNAAPGFTLVELLVALAIFITVMASITLIFNAAVRTSKQGFQNQEAYELARGTMKLFERDLNRAFTSRDHGDVFNFYGTPIGFTFVGLISADESDAQNMARVTYVIYHDTFQGQAVAVSEYDAKEGEIVPTYNLLRFIEPGMDTLDSFPIPWDFPMDPDISPDTFQDVVDQRVFDAACPDTGCEELVAQAARREIWIKMLSGGFPVDDPLTPQDDRIPNAWTELPEFVSRGLNPADYVVAENVRFLTLDSIASTATPYCAADIQSLTTLVENDGGSIDYDDIIYQNGTDICVRLITSPAFAPTFDDQTLATFSDTDGPRPYFTYWDIGVLTNEDPGPEDDLNTADDQVTPIAFQFWNDWRNMRADGLDNDGDNFALENDNVDNDFDGTTDEVNEGVDEPDEIYGENSGSPLDTRLPIAVTTDLTLFFKSPYPGAPDFNQRFTQRIDLPTAYRRRFVNPAP